MYWYQQKEESLQEFNFEISAIIQAVTNCDPKCKTDPLKIYMYVQKLCNPALSAKVTDMHT